MNKALTISPQVALSLVSIPLTLSAQDAAEKQPQRPNIVYIMTDDHTAQMMSAYDKRNISTPNLDRIAADGVRFTNSFVANSLSGPSRACMLTGKHSHVNGFRSNETDVFDGSQPTFPKYLQKAGYQTAIFGRWHLHTDPQGFNRWTIIPTDYRWDRAICRVSSTDYLAAKS
jgi:arylsulfatase A-like enzyme